MSAVPSIGRATRADRPAAPGAVAASELYERFSAQIFGYCFHQLGSREEAEDAVQTTFMNAFRGLARGIVPEAEQAWVFKIAHNVCLSRRRSSWRRGRVEAPNNMEVLQEVVPAKDKVADELIRLQDVLETMSESQRRAILLREWQGLSYREIAAELDLSQAAVETLIFRARRALASGLEDAPLEHRWPKRLRRGADAGGAVVFLKTLVGGGGGAAVKVATVVALAGATVATTAADRLHPHAHAAGTNVVAAPPSATSADSSALSAESAAPPRDAQPRALRAPSQRSTRPPASGAAKPSAPPAPAPAPSQAAPSTAAQETTSSSGAAPAPVHTKATKSNGRSVDAGKPGLPAASNPGKGKDRPKDSPVAPQPASPAPVAATSASEDHGPDTVPGQEKKGDGDSHGDGRGK